MLQSLFIFIFFVFCHFSLLASCSSCEQKQQHMNPEKMENQPHNQDVKSCICPKNFNPVCGTDKMTYSNPCSADCAGVKILHAGPCTEEEMSH